MAFDRSVPKVANSGIKSLGLSPSLFFSGKLQSEACQSLRLFTAYYQKSVTGLQSEI